MATATRLKRRLGAFLREVRFRAGKSALEAAGELKQNSASTLNRYEAGEVLPAWGTVRTLLGFYDATAEDLVRVSQLYDDAKDEPQSVRLPAAVPKAFRKLANAEREAARERVLAPCVLPALLQTQRYAQALVAAAHHFYDRDATSDHVIAARMNRQKPLNDPAPLVLHALIDEAVIRREVGGPEVLGEQLEHLLAVAERPNVMLQVIPFHVGGYSTMNGSCVIVDYPEPDATPGVYLEYPAGGAWVDNPDDVKRFATMFDEVIRLAHTPADTSTMIHRHLEVLRTHDLQ